MSDTPMTAPNAFFAVRGACFLIVFLWQWAERSVRCLSVPRLWCDRGLRLLFEICIHLLFGNCMLVAEFVFVQLTEVYLCYRMRIRKHKVFLLCLLGIFIVSFFHYYKALHNILLLQELSSSSTLKMFRGIFWRFPATDFHSQQDLYRHNHLKVEAIRVK